MLVDLQNGLLWILKVFQITDPDASPPRVEDQRSGGGLGSVTPGARSRWPNSARTVLWMAAATRAAWAAESLVLSMRTMKSLISGSSQLGKLGSKPCRGVKAGGGTFHAGCKKCK